MKKRTAEIIMVCKRQHNFGDFPSLKRAIAAYLSDRCGCPIEHYTDELINSAIWAAAMDYIDGMKDYQPSSFLYDIKRVMDFYNNHRSADRKQIDFYEAVCIAFQSADVMDGQRFVNGFSEENTRFVCAKH